MTIPLLSVSLKDCFEFGHVYTAMSRAVDLDNLYVETFDPKKIKANPEVKEFYEANQLM
jgi:ATP-dependent DNA helicase PIF1